MTGVASYTFLPWLRRGVSTAITRVDGGGAAEARASFTASVKLDASTDAGADPRTAGTTLELYGPGEIAGFDDGIIVRRAPETDTSGVEPNFFPAVDFDQADFPWRYTPARANDADRLRPWLVLAVLSDSGELDASSPAGSDGSLATITVTSGACLPDLSQSWAWAHVQVSAFADDETLDGVLTTEPERVVSRLMCPRRLDADTKYTAYLVPAFQRGRYTGLGQDLPDGLDGMEPAWNASDTAIQLPVYYQWSFETGDGDFEYLARLLRARATPESIGKRDMDVTDAGLNLPAAADGPLAVEGALKAPTMQSTAWSGVTHDTFLDSLESLLERPADLLDDGSATRLVAPPLYGCWHAEADRVDPARQARWFDALNTDPRTRVAAGLGTLVIQAQQQQLMAGAWQQVGRVNEINDQLRRAQLSREASIPLVERHVATFDAESRLMVTSPVLTRILGSPRTIAAVLAASPIARGAFEPRFRRILRPFGRIALRQGRSGGTSSGLLDRMNHGLSPAPSPPAPSGMATPESTRAAAWSRKSSCAFIILALVLLSIVGLVGLAYGNWALMIALVAVAAASLRAAFIRWPRPGDPAAVAAVAGLQPGDPEIAAATPPPAFVPAQGTAADPAPHSAPTTPALRSQAVDDLRAALADLVHETARPPAPGLTLVPADLTALSVKVVKALNPADTIAGALRGRLSLGPTLAWNPVDPLEPVMAAPEFPQPMYEPLRDLSPSWLLPGADQIPSNTVCLLETNQPFVESFMVGLNHEMARELLWNEYPTDQRGTCFRQFFDVRGYVPPEGDTVDPEKLLDILPIHEWGDSPLGVNSPRTLPSNGAYLVLLIRGELFRRFPRTIVLAVNATLGDDGKRALGDTEQHPVFRGTIGGDMTFFGFTLTPDQARGSTESGADQGWFFVLEEPPTEPRFGLDRAGDTYGKRVTDWNDISWGSLAADADALGTLRYVDLTATLPTTAVSSDDVTAWHVADGARASDLAYITYQRPFRVAIHGSDMLLEDA